MCLFFSVCHSTIQEAIPREGSKQKDHQTVRSDMEHQGIPRQSWKDVETFFGGDDEETINFGKRTEFAASDSLYKIQTLATIKESESTGHPEVESVETNSTPIHWKNGGEEWDGLVSASNGDILAVGVGSSLSIFGLNPDHFSEVLSLECSIDGLCWLPFSDILVYVSRTSQFGFVDARSGNLLLRKSLVSGARWKKIRFFGSLVDAEGRCLLLCLPENEPLLTLTLDRYSSWLEAIQSRNVAELKKLVSGISISSHDTGKRGFLDVTLLDNSLYSGLLLVERVSSCVWFCPIDTIKDFYLSEWLQNDPESEWIRAEVFSGGRYIVSLDQGGDLRLWDAYTLVGLETFTLSTHGTIRDFMIVEVERDSSSINKSRIFFLREKDDGESLDLEIRSLPDCSLIYSVNVSRNTRLVKTEWRDNAEGAVSLLEYVQSTDRGEKDSIRFRWITEAHPESRLHRLLSKALFDEARAFATQFNLDMQLVYTTQVNYIVSQLDWDKKTGDAETLFSTLKDCMGNISDPMSMARLCLSCANLPRAEWIWSLLCLAEAKLSQAQDTDGEDVLSRVLLAKRRLRTHQLVHGKEAEFGHAARWEDYVHGRNLIEMFEELLDAGKTEEAEIFWTREETSLRKDLLNREGGWRLIFEAAVRSVMERRVAESSWIKRLLQSFLINAAFLDNPRETGDVVAECLLALCHWLEVGDSEKWPGNALEFAGLPDEVMDSWMSSDEDSEMNAVTPAEQARAASSICILRSWGMSRESYCCRLVDLRGHLEELEKLGRVYNCRMSLDQFLKESKESICYRILDRVQAVELLPVSIQKYARQYMKEKLLNEDETLYRYVLDIAEHASLASSSGGAMGEAPWENRALVVIKAIQSLEVYSLCVLAVAKRAKIPWSSPVTQLIHSAMKLNNQTLNVELANQKRLANLRNILNKYLIRGQQVKSSLHSRGRLFKLLCSVLNTHPAPETVGDLAEAARLSQLLPPQDIYLHHILNLSIHHKIGDVVNLLDSLSGDLGESVGRRVLLRIEVHLNSSSDYHKEHGETFIAVYNSFVRERLNPEERLAYDNLVRAIRNCRRLEEEFRVPLKLSLIQRVSVAQDMHYGAVGDRSDKALLTLASLTHLGALLKVGRVALDKGNLPLATTCLRLYCSEETSPSRWNVEGAFSLFCRSVKEMSSSHSSPPDFKAWLTSILVPLNWIIRNMESLKCLPALKISSFINIVLRILSQSDPASKLEYSTVKDDISGMSRHSGVYSVENDGLFIDGKQSTSLLKKALHGFVSIVSGMREEGRSLPEWTEVGDLLRTQDHKLLLIRGLLFRLSYLGGTPSEVSSLHKEVESALRSLISKSTPATQDLCLALCLFLLLPDKQNFKLLSAIKKELVPAQTRSLAILIDIGRGAAALNGELELFMSSDELAKVTRWAMRLGKYSILVDTTSLGYTERMEVVSEFVGHDVPVRLFQLYCEDFGLDVVEATSKYLKAALQGDGKSGMARSALRYLTSSQFEQIGKELKKMLVEDVDPYNYETIDFLLGTLDNANDGLDGSGVSVGKLIALSSFLSAQSRKSPPGKEEKSWYWGRLKPNYASPTNFLMDDSDFDICGDEDLGVGSRSKMPEASQTHLPFHLFLPAGRANQADPVLVKVLEAEISLGNMTLWQRFAGNTSPVKLSENLMLLQAVQNSVMEHPPHSDQAGTVEMGAETMADVKAVLTNARDPQVALKCIGWLTKKLPFGTQRLETIQCGLSVAQRWLASAKSQGNGEQEKGALQFLTNFEGVWRKLGTELLLKQYGLLNKASSALILSPAKLILHLYDSLRPNPNHKRQVSIVVPKIAELNGVNLQKIQSFVLDKSLPPPSSRTPSSCMDETGIGGTLKKSQTGPSWFPFTDPELSKAVFVLEQWDSRQASYHLLSILNQEKPGSADSQAKIRAVCCLLRLLSPSLIQTHMGLHIDHLRNKLSELLYVDKMERASLPWTMKAFATSNKESVANALWRTRAQNQMVTPIVSSMCIDFEIVRCDLVEEVLRELANSGPRSLFREVLFHCERTKGLWMIPTLPTFWTRYCLSLLSESESLKRGDPVNELKKTSHLFLKCPKYNEVVLKQMIQALEQFAEDSAVTTFKSSKLLAFL